MKRENVVCSNAVASTVTPTLLSVLNVKKEVIKESEEKKTEMKNRHNHDACVFV